MDMKLEEKFKKFEGSIEIDEVVVMWNCDSFIFHQIFNVHLWFSSICFILDFYYKICNIYFFKLKNHFKNQLYYF
jgi:hypothetical protein